MGFMKPLAQVGTFGLAGLALSKKKKPLANPNAPTNSGYFPGAASTPPPSMLTRRGGY